MVNGNIKLSYDDKTITLPKLGPIKCKYHRYIPKDYIVKSVTVSKSPTNKYYVSILTEYEYDIPYRILDSNKSIGLDYSSNSLYVDSNGESINMPHYYRQLESKLAKENRKLSHMKLHSNNWYKQQNRINKIHENFVRFEALCLWNNHYLLVLGVFVLSLIIREVLSTLLIKLFVSILTVVEAVTGIAAL